MTMERQPVAMWGREHWQTFYLIELAVVTNSGRPDYNRIRCNNAKNPHRRSPGAPFQQDYPPSTTLMNGTVLDGYDDWDCIEDMIHAGLLEWNGTGASPMFALTCAGWKIASQLRQDVARNNGKVRGDKFKPKLSKGGDKWCEKCGSNTCVNSWGTES